ncbi:MAG: hypothetical protein U0350_18555 [Caldilineaceae bacterium]
MRGHLSLLLTTTILVMLTACTEPIQPAAHAPPTGLINCAVMTPAPDRGSLLPPFTPAYACALENRSKYVDFCMVQASPTLSYPCSQTESVQESVIGKGRVTQLIRRDYHFAWDGREGGWRHYRLHTDGSGALEKLP